MDTSGQTRNRLSATCLLVVMVVSGLAGCVLPDERSASVLPAATIRNLMVGKTIPASKVVFEVANEAPKSEAGWQAVHASAQQLVDAGERLQVGARGPGKDEWITFARTMANAAEQATTAAALKNADGVAEAGNSIYEACEGCHRSFMKKAGAASGPEAS